MRMLVYGFIICHITMGFLCPILHGATTSYTGREGGFWDDHAVVIGQVKSLKEEKGIVDLILEIKAVVATDFMIPTIIDVKYVKDRSSAMMMTTLEKGDIIIACVLKIRGKWKFPSSFIYLFGDHHTAVVKLSSINALEVKQYILDVKNARKESLIKTLAKEMPRVRKLD